MKKCYIGLVDKLNPRDSVKGGRTEVFRMYCNVRDPQHEKIRYFYVNSLYPYVMSEIDYPLGHPEIRRGNYSCRNLLHKLKMKNKKFIGICQVRVLPPVIYSFHAWLIRWVRNCHFVCVEHVLLMVLFKEVVVLIMNWKDLG